MTDFDGVIANSEPLHYQAFREVLGQSGIAFAEKEHYDRPPSASRLKTHGRAALDADLVISSLDELDSG